MSCTYSLYNSEGKQHHIYVIWIYHVDIVNTHCHESDTTLLDVAGRSTNSSLSEVTGCAHVKNLIHFKVTFGFKPTSTNYWIIELILLVGTSPCSRARHQ
ncbi:unnamed protein product [Clavelina lepadiformis]|uniref:Uncharacterized protein n=1 Tax=Clavelina lepadiformis TaxID=159417 RepID=A0ABP0GC68_CLALP